MDNKWLDALKVGDIVFIDDNRDLRESKIVRTTKTMIVCEGYQKGQETKFKKDGSRRIDAWSWQHICPDNDQYRQKFHKQNLLSSINTVTYRLYNATDYKDMSIQKLQRIEYALKGIEITIKGEDTNV